MKLLYQTHSPYARKALVFARSGPRTGIEVEHHETSPTQRNPKVFAENPLGKVPVLVRPGLPSLFDSDVICAYLDTLNDRSQAHSRSRGGALARPSGPGSARRARLMPASPCAGKP